MVYASRTFIVLIGLLALVGVIGFSTTASAKTGHVPWVADCIDFSSETNCDDADGDGWFHDVETILGSDPDSSSSTPEYGLLDEQTGLNTCRDHVDNDGDGRSDWRDPGCRVICGDYAGQAKCADPDHDGVKNYVEVHYESNPRDHLSTPEARGFGQSCSDGLDNDKDGKVDYADSSCPIENCIDFDAETVCELG